MSDNDDSPNVAVLMLCPKVFNNTHEFKDWLPYAKLYIEKLNPTNDEERILYLKNNLEGEALTVAKIKCPPKIFIAEWRTINLSLIHI